MLYRKNDGESIEKIVVWGKSRAMKFAVFITSHERADRVLTYTALRKSGYTHDIYVVIDDEDDIAAYKLNYGKEVLVFNKQTYIDKCDTVVPTTQRASVTYPRIFVEEKARDLGLDAFMVIDDDMPTFRYRWVEDGKVRSLSMKSGMDDVLNYYAQFIIKHNIAVTTFVHTMFYIGGVSGLDRRITEQRELNGVFIRNTKFDVEWTGVMRQDMITNLLTSRRGYVWWALPFVVFETLPMNEHGVNDGGMKETYDNIDNYERSFLGVIAVPSCLKVGCANGRIKIVCDWNKGCAKIVSGRYKK